MFLSLNANHLFNLLKTENKPHLNETSGTITIETYIIFVWEAFHVLNDLLCVYLFQQIDMPNQWCANFFLARAKFANKIEPRAKNLLKFYPNFHIFKLFELRKWKVSLLLKDYCEPRNKPSRAKFGLWFAQRCSKLYLSNSKLYISNWNIK